MLPSPTLSALVDTLLTGAPSTDGGLPYSPASVAGVDKDVADRVTTLPAREQAEMARLLRAVDNWFLNLLLSGRPPPGSHYGARGRVPVPDPDVGRAPSDGRGVRFETVDEGAHGPWIEVGDGMRPISPVELDRFLAAVESRRIRKNAVALFSAHPMGSARAGADPNRSAAQPTGEVHGVEGLWIGDESLLPTAPGANPMMSILAYAERTAVELVNRLSSAGSVDGGRSGQSPFASNRLT